VQCHFSHINTLGASRTTKVTLTLRLMNQGVFLSYPRSTYRASQKNLIVFKGVLLQYIMPQKGDPCIKIFITFSGVSLVQ